MNHRWNWIRVIIGATLIVSGPHAAEAASRDAVTFAEDVAPILMQRCAECHRPDAIAPMSLLTYAEARPWAKAIKNAVLEREMPPWDADPEIGRFANDISLGQSEIDTLIAWVDQGARAGDLSKMPEPPRFPEQWRLGEPDYVVDLPEYAVAAEGDDLFPNLIFSLDLPRDVNLKAVELRAGDPRALHHMLLFKGFVTMSEEVVDRRPATRRGGSPLQAPNTMYVWAAGSPPAVFPEGMGHRLSATETLSINAHYHPFGDATIDRSRLGLYFTDEPLEKEITTAVAVNPSLRIPPGSTDYEQRAYYLFSQDSRLISFLPHMHVRGSAISYVLHYPDASSQTVLNVPKFDYDWQWIYYPTDPVPAPAGTILEVTGRWDNSAANPLNPAPNQWIRFGDGTNDEMLVGFAEFVVENGVRPQPQPPGEKVRQALALHDETHGYVVEAGPLTTGLYLPPEGEGMLYLAVGDVMVSASIHDIVWDGGCAVMNSRMLTGAADSVPLGVRLDPRADGLTGTLYFGRQLNESHLSDPPPGGQAYPVARLAPAPATD